MHMNWSKALQDLQDKGMTQGEIAAAIPCTQGRVSQLLKTNPVRIPANTARSIEALCHIKGIRIEAAKEKAPTVS